MTRLVLGSASPGRLKVLRQAGIDPLVMVSGVDEDAVVAGLEPDASPARVVCALAEAKAEAGGRGSWTRDVAADCVVIGCDSMLYIDGRLCGKPRSVADARATVAVDGRPRRPTLYRPLRDPAADNEIVLSRRRNISHHSTFRSTVAGRSGGLPGQRGVACGSRADSPSTAWAAGSSTASTATRRPWSASACR